MAEGLKEGWRRFKAGAPGERFREHYRHRRESSPGGARRYLVMAGGIILLLLGLFLLPAPGPGMVVVALGGALMAGESYAVASLLDWLEPRVRRIAVAGGHWWKRASPALKNTLLVAAAGLGAAAGWGAYVYWIAA
jgi:hypothetical protein